jgi:hypothetical protein
MRRFYVLAIAAISVYCLTDAFASSGGETAGHASKPIFSAEIVDAPIVANGESAVSNDVSVANSQAPSREESDVPTAADVSSSPAKPDSASPVPASRLAKAHAAVVAPRGPSRHAATADTVVPAATLPVPAYVAPTWQPPVQRVAVLQRSAVSGGCSGGKWSQPDAAGVPVLICD